jgi:DNA replication protein DnaC/uncharacterized protein YbaR (Trm112 family)
LDRVIKAKKNVSGEKRSDESKNKKKRQLSQGNSGIYGSGLKKNYTFDKFIVGTNTRFTYAACKAVANKPGKNYNPLFVYGGVGLGNTHLMQAIGHHVKENFPEMRVVYVSCGKFINEVVEAIEKGTINNLRNKFKNIDLLLIDDIQFLEQSESTQEEFFHIFNEMHEVEKQIILTSDKPPKKLVTLEERLQSRFEWGLTTDVKSPNFETRKAILKTKSAESNLELPDKINDFIAERLTSNIRELEGIINRIAAYQELSEENSAVNIGLVKDIMRNILPEEEEEGKDEKTRPGHEEKNKDKRPPPSARPEINPPGYSPAPPAPGYNQQYGHACPRCRSPLNYIPQYQRWYCNNCGTYTDPASGSPPQPGNYSGYYSQPSSMPPPPPSQPQAAPSRPCPKCSAELKYISEYEQYYCPNCKKYEQEMTEKPERPQKAKKKKPDGFKEDSGKSAESEEQNIENIIIGEKKADTRVIKAGYFIVEGDQKVAIDIAKRLSKIARRKNIKFYLETLFAHFYPKNVNINYAKMAHITKNNKADIVLCLEPSPKGDLETEEFKDGFSSVMDKANIPYAFLPQGEMKDSDALNLMLDIAICAKKRKK